MTSSMQNMRERNESEDTDVDMHVLESEIIAGAPFLAKSFTQSKVEDLRD